MAQLILRADVAGVGKRGDIVDVATGFARNFLLPRGLAMTASQGSVEQAAKMRKSRDLRDAKDREASGGRLLSFHRRTEGRDWMLPGFRRHGATLARARPPSFLHKLAGVETDVCGPPGGGCGGDNRHARHRAW